MRQLDLEKILQAAALLGSVAAGDPRSDVTIRELWEEWKAHASMTLRSWSAYEEKGRPVLMAFGDRVATSIQPTEIDRYRVERLGQLTRRRKPPTPATLNRELAVLKRVLNFGVERGRIERNPIANVKLLPERNRRRAKIADDRQLDLFLKDASDVVAALTLVGIDTGMRRMEVFALHESQIDWQNGTVDLGQTETKTGLPRRPRLSPRALEAIRNLPHPNGWIFGNPDTGKPFTPGCLYRRYRRQAKAAGVEGPHGEPLVYHSLRHSFVYRARRHWGLPERTVMAMGGWRTTSAIERYGAPDEVECSDAWDRMHGNAAQEKRIGPKKILTPAPILGERVRAR